MAQEGVGVGDGVVQIPNQSKIKLSLENISNQIKSNQIKSNQIKSNHSKVLLFTIQSREKNKQEKGIDDPK